jgi:hypothetical protein
MTIRRDDGRRPGPCPSLRTCHAPLVAHCHVGLGKLYRRTGDRANAQKHLTTARTMYREMGTGFWLEKVGAEVGGVERYGR